MLVLVNQDALEEFVAIVAALLEIWCGHCSRCELFKAQRATVIISVVRRSAV